MGTLGTPDQFILALNSAFLAPVLLLVVAGIAALFRLFVSLVGRNPAS